MDILSLTLNIFGTIILAISTGKFFKWISYCLNMHEISIQTMFSQGNVINVSGTTKHLDDALKKSAFWMILGVLFLIIGFGIQLFLLILKNV